MTGVSRRAALAGAAGLAVTAGTWPRRLAARALPEAAEPRTLRLHNVHTGENFHDAYHNGEGYLARTRAGLDHFLRDHWTDVVHPIDPRVYDLLWRLDMTYLRRHGRRVTINIHSAYRTPETNERLRSEGAAQNSFHMAGQAIDISVQGFGVYFLGDIVQAVGAGGVGIYWRSKFAHLDTGPRRIWYQRM
ncbi:MAG: DUF882 domain-containing protein [Inquilinaceae bacterium]